MYHHVANESLESGGVDICSSFLVPPSEGSSVGGRFLLLQEKGGGLDLKYDRLMFVMRGVTSWMKLLITSMNSTNLRIQETNHLIKELRKCSTLFASHNLGF